MHSSRLNTHHSHTVSPGLLQSSEPLWVPPISEQPLVRTLEINHFPLVNGGYLEEARLGFCILGNCPANPHIVLHPALTGSPKVVTEETASQGDGWWNDYVGRGKFLDTDRFNIICVDPLGGNGYSTSAKELLQFKSSLCFKDSINLITEVLTQKLGVSSLYAIVGGSIGGGQALEWLFQDKISVQKIIDISGKSGEQPIANEFFTIQSDLIWGNGSNIDEIAERLRTNCSDITSLSEGLDEAIKFTVQEVLNLRDSFSAANANAVARKIGFLRFVTPRFFQKKYERWRDLKEDPVVQLHSWFDHQGETFKKRFAPEALAQLCSMTGRGVPKTSSEIAQKITEKGVSLMGFAVKGDILFPEEKQRAFYSDLRSQLGEHNEQLSFQSIQDQVNGHDHFLTGDFQKSSLILKQWLEN